MDKEYYLARRLLIGVAISSVCISIGSSFHTEIVKYAAGLSQIYILILSFIIIHRFSDDINWRRARIILFITVCYPLVRIIFDSLSNVTNDDFKFLTDGLIVNGSYYELAFVGLAMAALLRRYNGFQLIYRLSFYALLIGGGILLASLITPLPAQKIVIGQSAIINCFIPVALLALQPYKNRAKLIGWTAIVLILFLSIKIYSRSFTLVAFYFMVFGIIGFFTSGQKKLGVVIVIILSGAVYFGAPALFSQQSALGDGSIADKYQFGSLGKSLEKFSEDGDFLKLFFWEGNSRSEIIVDAFRDFDETEWMFGRGLFGTYKSFITRSTIELGWAEELFRWGIFYVVLFIFVVIYCRRKLRKEKYFLWNELAKPLYGLLLIRFLDGFIYGLPQNSVYNLFFFTGLMTISIYKKDRRKVQVKTEPQNHLVIQ